MLNLFVMGDFLFQAQLQWPTGLALSPLDGAIHFIDDRLILKLTPEMKVSVVAGTPLHCHKTLNRTTEVEKELGKSQKRKIIPKL